MIGRPVETRRAFLLWQGRDEAGVRRRHRVAELRKAGDRTHFSYLVGSEMEAARAAGFSHYPGLPMKPPPDPAKGLEVLCHRLMPSSRPDYESWLNGHGISARHGLSGLSLLAYTGARSLRDTFSVCDSLDGFDGRFSYVFHVAGYRFRRDAGAELFVGQPMRFAREGPDGSDPSAICVQTQETPSRSMGHVNIFQTVPVGRWLEHGTIEARVFRIHDRTDFPRLWVHADIVSDAGAPGA